MVRPQSTIPTADRLKIYQNLQEHMCTEQYITSLHAISLRMFEKMLKYGSANFCSC